jgi:hypothetical protein
MKKLFLALAVFAFATSALRKQRRSGRFSIVERYSTHRADDEKGDFYTAFTARFGKNVSRVNDSRFAVGFIYKANKSLSFQPFYCASTLACER